LLTIPKENDVYLFAKLTIITLISLHHGTSFSQWVKINETNQSVHFIDKSTIVKKSNIISVWWLMNFKPHIANETQFKSVVGYSRVDCKKRLLMGVKSTAYSDSFGNGIGTPASGSKKWENPSPNSLQNSVINEVCR
jgi:hypothetical protein